MTEQTWLARALAEADARVQERIERRAAQAMVRIKFDFETARRSAGQKFSRRCLKVGPK